MGPGGATEDEDTRRRLAAMQKLAALAACPQWPLAASAEAEASTAAAEAVLGAVGANLVATGYR